ncbi:Pyridine nucleotide-disulfide oxidoreductase [uncultured Eubacteriales bacterium]|uniref:Pyridine nucleotide-disulfide oxidoreductase n=1 Tax=uncultured Eubacteriales bacterium TaxID=172733 RepID=A0A212KBD3_9FIRM|nr:Pyridine nucleotide-disulfide oxidoreductase [uncultured Eubacteriales bacterium]
MKIVIVGGVAGGASAAARLRRLDEHAEIIMLEQGDYISYANCGLPYYVGGEITDKEDLTLQTPESFRARFRIDVRVRSRAEDIDTAGRTVTVKNLTTGGTYTEPYDKLILSPGAEPLRPPLPGVEDERVFTLRSIPDTFRIHYYVDQKSPKTAVVVGGGFIGLEMAENLMNAGLKVSVVEKADHLVAALDYDMACEVHRYARSKGLSLYLNKGVTGFTPGSEGLTVGLDDGSCLSADMVLLSVGVRPETALAKAAGLTLNARGAIVVSAHMQTSDPHIYAVGDAVEITNFVSNQPGYVPLAGPANKQGRIAADHICGIDSSYKGTQGSAILKLFDMTVAATGLTEDGARRAGIDAEKTFTLSSSHASYYPGAKNIRIKAVYEKETGKILGAQLVGFDGVDKRADVLAASIRAGMKADDLTELELCYAPPFSSAKDPVNMLGYVVENLVTGKVKQFHWHDVPTVLEDPDAFLLDVRTDGEYRSGNIPGAAHIPLDSLRDRLGELPKDKTLYVHCQSGLRSYLACRILSQEGWDCYNLAGGYGFYETVTGESAYDETPRHPCGVKI